MTVPRHAAISRLTLPKSPRMPVLSIACACHNPVMFLLKLNASKLSAPIMQMSNTMSPWGAVDLLSPHQHREHSTIHQTFVLQHASDKHRRLRSPLYLRFVHLKSAYDRVQWQLLWDLLRRLGVQGTMLGAIQSLYDGCVLSMRVNGVTATTPPLDCVAAGLPPQRHPVWPIH